MSNPISIIPTQSSVNPLTSRPVGGAGSAAGGENFADALRSQIEEVSRIQREADQNVQSLLTGQSDNLAQVFTAARKAEVAFSLLMEMRNKLADAYVELRQLRV